MYRRFGLVLTVNHACNLRCTYCYTGEKFNRAIPEEIGRFAIDRAMRSIGNGGTLELGFFGGEPLLEADRVLALIGYARAKAALHRISLELTLTTNGTRSDAAAWNVMILPDLDLAISHDGLPEIHDRHRRTVSGCGTSGVVLETMRKLIVAGKNFKVVMVVRPDTVDLLPEGIVFLQSHGVRWIEPSLDLWTTWDERDITRLESAVARSADLWRRTLPNCAIGWFDEKAAKLARLDVGQTARCGFGDGEVAVAPSGRLYPCERLMGEDVAASRAFVIGHVFDGDRFMPSRAPERSDDACTSCAMHSECSTTCRCSNVIRTGDVRRPDGLLCRWNQACLLETARVLRNEVERPKRVSLVVR